MTGPPQKRYAEKNTTAEDTVFAWMSRVGKLVEPSSLSGNLGGGFKYVLFSPLLMEDSHFD